MNNTCAYITTLFIHFSVAGSEARRATEITAGTYVLIIYVVVLLGIVLLIVCLFSMCINRNTGLINTGLIFAQLHCG